MIPTIDYLEALKRAIDLAGGQSALARDICAVGGYARQCHVSAWLNRNKKVPASQVIRVEKAVNGAVTRHELRPDLYPAD